MTRMFSISDPSEARGRTITAREILDRASSDVEQRLAKDPELQARMMVTMGSVYRKLGSSVGPSRSWSVLSRFVEPFLDPTMPRRWRRPWSSEWSSGTAGPYVDAEKLLRQVLEVRRRVLGPEHPDTLETMSRLGVVLKDAELPGPSLSSDECWRSG
jgi:non-specific serine/threonine protein kinase/serine/threonine-protein kinase